MKSAEEKVNYHLNNDFTHCVQTRIQIDLRYTVKICCMIDNFTFYIITCNFHIKRHQEPRRSVLTVLTLTCCAPAEGWVVLITAFCWRRRRAAMSSANGLLMLCFGAWKIDSEGFRQKYISPPPLKQKISNQIPLYQSLW